jgi:hypothetical protein
VAGRVGADRRSRRGRYGVRSAGAPRPSSLRPACVAAPVRCADKPTSLRSCGVRPGGRFPETGVVAAQGGETGRMGHWIVQANPAHWRIRDFFDDGHRSISWTVRRHRDRIAAGDDVALWLSGRAGGVVAVGRVAAEPYHGTEPEWATAYRTEGHEDREERWLMPVEFAHVFLDDPVRRDTLRADRRFAGALILRMAGGGNPFPVTGAEWPAIAGRVPRRGEHAVVATAVRGTAALVAGGATAVREAVRSVVG